jgi:hypothetical protein
MIPLTMIGFDEFGHCSSEVALSERQHPVKAFLGDCSSAAAHTSTSER